MAPLTMLPVGAQVVEVLQMGYHTQGRQALRGRGTKVAFQTEMDLAVLPAVEVLELQDPTAQPQQLVSALEAVEVRGCPYHSSSSMVTLLGGLVEAAAVGATLMVLRAQPVALLAMVGVEVARSLMLRMEMTRSQTLAVAEAVETRKVLQAVLAALVS